jgi:hypothetical protein
VLEVRRAGDPVSEKAIETAIREALAKASCFIKKNRIEACWSCGAKPKKTDGLGLGSSDLIGCTGPYGRLLAIEVKSETGRTMEEQQRFIDVVRRYKGVAGVARSVEEAFRLLDMARRLP